VNGGTVIAVDGGNSKTDLAIVGVDGTVASFVRGAGSSPHRIGTAGALDLIEQLLNQALAGASAGPARGSRPLAAVLLVAGADLPGEERELRRQAQLRGWADMLEVGNDTLAVLRVGSPSATGVAVVCGAGINALALAADGRSARFPALGAITGDWGGGADLGLAALGAAVRADDGRGAPTLLATLVPDHFGLASSEQVAFAVHRHEISAVRLLELAPLAMQAAELGDPVADGLIDRLAVEIVTMARAAAGRVFPAAEPYDLVLGGGLLSPSSAVTARLQRRLPAELPAARPTICDLPPVAGSALLALDLVGAGEQAIERVREQMRRVNAGPEGPVAATAEEARHE